MAASQYAFEQWCSECGSLDLVEDRANGDVVCTVWSLCMPADPQALHSCPQSRLVSPCRTAELWLSPTSWMKAQSGVPLATT